MIGRTPGQHQGGAAAAGRRDRRLRGDRARCCATSSARCSPPRRLHRTADRDLRAVRDHRRRAARGQGVGLRGRRAPGAHHRRADGGRDRCRAAGQPAVRLHGRRHRRRHHRGRGALAGRHRRLAVSSGGRRRARHGDRRPRAQRVLAADRRAHRRGAQDLGRLGVPAVAERTPRSAAATWPPACRTLSSPATSCARRWSADRRIVAAVPHTLDRCPPELAGDLITAASC